MRILFLAQLVPYPADAGPKVRIYHVLQYLASAGHQVTLVAFHRPGDRPEQVDHLRRYCQAIHTVLMPRSRPRDAWRLAYSLLTGQPFLIARDDVAAMRRLLERLLAQDTFDAIHADQLWMAQYALAARSGRRGNRRPMTVLDQHNAVYLIPQRLAAGAGNPIGRALLALEGRKMSGYEVAACRHFDHVVWVTDEDRAALAHAAGGAAPATGLTIPICVDPQATPPVPRPENARRVTFLGGMHWPPNGQGVTWFANQVWPLILEQVPEAIFTVIGKSPPAAVREPESKRRNVEVAGYVADPLPYLAETAAFVVPLHAGGGMRVKILDAWCWGLPVVSTTIGAEGICYQDGRDLLIADSPEAFAQAVIRLLSEPAW
ncbi:MAG: glycosyltransferase, partial [Chloroflexi bacterium]|nr:glycosyltransferase [Chloroflexota bacterium]